jgi:hypothetical protein
LWWLATLKLVELPKNGAESIGASIVGKRVAVFNKKFGENGGRGGVRGQESGVRQKGALAKALRRNGNAKKRRGEGALIEP